MQDMNTITRSLEFGICALVLAGLSGCASTRTDSAATGSDSGESWALVQPYHHPIAGIGGGDIIGSLKIPENGQDRVASLALVMALQARQLSLQEPRIGVDGVIPAKTPWTTDIAPITPDELALYNQAYSRLPLRNAIYGVAFKGLHDTSGQLFRYKISALLYERGAISDWSRVNDNLYFGSFFVTRLVSEIMSQLKAGALH
jgi:hypothetical protein